MKILLIQPAQERGLGFRSLAIVEPLGLESIAGSLPGHEIRILDLRLENNLPLPGKRSTAAVGADFRQIRLRFSA